METAKIRNVYAMEWFLQENLINSLTKKMTRSSKIEVLAKIANGLDTLSCLLFLQKAQSKMLVGFLNLPFAYFRFFQARAKV